LYAGDVINGKLDHAKKENEFIYHEKVVDVDTLPEIKGASLVKGIPFDVSDPEVSGKDIFHRLVPLEAHEASSLYSEEHAKLLR
jgi:tyrosine-protein phosphatase non-receptor type 23